MLKLHLLIYCVPSCTATAHMRRSEGKHQELVLSYHHVGPRHQTRVFRGVSELLYLLSHLAGPNTSYLIDGNVKTHGDK